MVITLINYNDNLPCLNYYPNHVLFKIYKHIDVIILKATLAPSIGNNFVYAKLMIMIMV